MSNVVYILLIIVALVCVYLVSLPEPEEKFMITSIKEHLAQVDPRFAELDIRESDSSYTEDKSVIFLCLKDENGQVYPMNTIMYVALHEIAHLLNKKDFGHTPAFHQVFDRLLCKASAKGVYDPSQPHTPFYCGVDIRGISMPSCSNIRNVLSDEYQ